MTDSPPEISEERMRAALLLTGSPFSSAPSQNQSHRPRRRFVQDGEVPVVVVNPRQQRPEEDRGIIAELQRALSNEREARLVAERSLQKAEETVRQLQTRLAHAEIARKEAVAAPAPVEPAPVALAPSTPPSLADEIASVFPMTAAAAPMPAPAPAPVEKIRSAPAVRHKAKVETQAVSEEELDQSVEWWKPGWRERFRNNQS